MSFPQEKGILMRSVLRPALVGLAVAGLAFAGAASAQACGDSPSASHSFEDNFNDFLINDSFNDNIVDGDLTIN
jgi:hypothetical protein